MQREELEHLIRAAAAITNQYEIVIIGSQSILGTYPKASDDLLYSQEADMYPLEDPASSDLIDGAIGEDSPFHERFGYYAQGVDDTTAVLPSGWRERLVRIQNANTDLKIGLCLEPHDLAASKLYAARPKDIDFVRSMIGQGLVDCDVLHGRIALLPVSDEMRDAVCRKLNGLREQLTQDNDASPSP